MVISPIYDSDSLAGDSHFVLSLKIVRVSGNFLERNWHRPTSKEIPEKASELHITVLAPRRSQEFNSVGYRDALSII